MSNSTESHNLAEHEPAEHRAAEPIDLLGYLKRMGHYWIAGLVAAVIVAGALLGFGATRQADPVGSTWAKAHVMVTMPEPKTTALGAASADSGTRLLASYVAVSDSDVLLNDAAKRLGDGTKVPTLKSATSLYSGGGSQVLAVYALGTDEAQAQKRANAYAEALVANGSKVLPQSVQGLGTPTFTVVEKAGPSSASPDPTVTTGSSNAAALLESPLIAVVLGVVAGVIVMGVAEITVGRRRS